MGLPKALLRDPAGVPYLDRAIGTLFEGGCTEVTVVLGAAAPEATEILREHGWLDDPDLAVVHCESWDAGLGASLKAGLATLDSEAALVLLVDLPDVHDDAVRRVASGAAADSLVRATYGGNPGHPVLIGRDHWAGVLDAVSGDRGARDYLDQHGARDVPCDDLATGRDVDLPEDLPRSLDE